MNTLRAGISSSDDTQVACVFDLPGCSYTAETRRELDEMLPVVVAEYVGWLAQHGEAIDAESIKVVEEIDIASADGVEGEFVFDDDRRALADPDIERALRWMRYSRADLLSLIEGLSDAVLDWRPPASAMARLDPWKPAPLTIREIIDDIASAELYYRTSLIDGPCAEDDSPAGLAGLTAQRERVEAMLSALPAEHRGRVFAPQRPWQDGAERWTARKVVRRIVGHERFHTAEIQQRLTWVLLGTPTLRRASGESAE